MVTRSHTEPIFLRPSTAFLLHARQRTHMHTANTHPHTHTHTPQYAHTHTHTHTPGRCQKPLRHPGCRSSAVAGCRPKHPQVTVSLRNRIKSPQCWPSKHWYTGGRAPHTKQMAAANLTPLHKCLLLSASKVNRRPHNNLYVLRSTKRISIRQTYRPTEAQQGAQLPPGPQRPQNC